jgi:hypothetical protein
VQIQIQSCGTCASDPFNRASPRSKSGPGSQVRVVSASALHQLTNVVCAGACLPREHWLSRAVDGGLVAASNATRCRRARLFFSISMPIVEVTTAVLVGPVHITGSLSSQ